MNQTRATAMKPNARTQNATLAGLAAIGLALVTGGFSHFAAAQDAPPTEAAVKRAEKKQARLFALPGPEFPQPRLLGRRPRPHRLLLRLGNVRDHADPRRPLQSCHGRGSRRWTTASASNRTGRWTGSPSPTMPSISASPIKFATGSPELLANPQGKTLV